MVFILPAYEPERWHSDSVEWQRCFALSRRHVKAGGKLAGAEPGSIAVQSEDLAGWARARRIRWERPGPA
ncbi:hypothetical protein ACFXKJ_40600 [Kitasatospora indigofera]|uniref:hypothetical protein n=1 Tax=Kitasatospora indigofera TaxID=67307 RepID=UPI0036C057D8